MERQCRFVAGGLVRLPLPGNEWIDVKTELNAGESRRVFTQLVKEMNAGEPTKLDPDKVGITKMIEYIAGWSLLNSEGQPEPISEDAFDALDQETYQDIADAVEQHDQRCEAARIARKNARGGGMKSSPISPSPDSVAGDLSGCAN